MTQPSQTVESMSRRQLNVALTAANDAIAVMSELATQGRSVVSAVLAGTRQPVAWVHYPDGELRDSNSGYRCFYHCHERPSPGEHGHFHVFSEVPSTESGARPALTHLIAIGVDARGQPMRAFTVNRWVTDEFWQPAARVLRLLGRFTMKADEALAPVTRWLMAILKLFERQIRALLLARDARVASSSVGARRPNLFDDRRTEVLSQCRLSLSAQVGLLRRSLQSRA